MPELNRSSRVFRVMGTRFFGETVGEMATGNVRVVETRHPAGERLSWHSHRAGYVAIVLDGGYREHVRGATRDCLPSTAIVHPAGEAHANTFIDAPTHLLSIEIVRGAATRLLQKPSLICGARVRSFASLIQHERDPIAIDALLIDLLASSSWLPRADAIVRERFSDPITVHDVAGELRRHPTHVARAFRAAFGITVGERIRQMRVKAAKSMLATSPQPIADIALALHFADQSHFTRCFGRIVGITPAAYRRRYATIE